MTGASFNTIGPTGSYVLDFIYDILLNACAGVDIDLGELGSITRVGQPRHDRHRTGLLNVLDLDSDTLGGTIEFPPPLDAFSVNFAWPNITTSGTFPPNPVTADGASNNFLELVLDVDTLVTQLLGIPNVFDPPRLTAGPFFADIDLLDVDVIGGLNFLQDFALELGDLTGILTFEDGSSQLFHIGDSLLINDASLIDAGGDDDGLVEFQFDVVPTATLHNQTDLGFNIGVEVSLLSVELGYDIEIASDSTTLGPLANFGATAPVGDINVFNSTFGLNFGQKIYSGSPEPPRSVPRHHAGAPDPARAALDHSGTAFLFRTSASRRMMLHVAPHHISPGPDIAALLVALAASRQRAARPANTAARARRRRDRRPARPPADRQMDGRRRTARSRTGSARPSRASICTSRST